MTGKEKSKPNYRVINLEQGTLEWHKFRQTHIGASDAAIIMGESPWKTPYDLYLEKSGFKLGDEPNYFMKRGTDLEPFARAKVNKASKEIFIPMVLEYLEKEFISCSLDGINEDGDIILEIKCPSKANHQKAINQEIPRHYMIQIQHQLMVTNAKECIYASYHPDHEQVLATIPVFPDYELQRKILEAELKFWDHVMNLDMPMPCKTA